MVNEALRRVSASIPPLAWSCQTLLTLAHREDTDTRVVERDDRVALELLRLANSAYFARRSRVTTVCGAVVVMGVHDALRAAIAAAMTGLFARGRVAFSDAEIVDTCLTFARAWGAGGEADATAGLLMPLGLLVLQQYRPAEFAQLVACAGHTADFEELHVLERRLFGLTRCEALCEAASVWQLPEALTGALDRWHVCSGVATPQYVATAATAHAIEGAFFKAVALR